MIEGAGGVDVSMTLFYVVCNKLVSDHCPILNLAAVPFFVKFGDSEIEHFKKCVFVRKSSFFSNFAKTGINALDSISSIHYSS